MDWEHQHSQRIGMDEAEDALESELKELHMDKVVVVQLEKLDSWRSREASPLTVVDIES